MRTMPINPIKYQNNLKQINIKEISAEMLLNLLYPDMGERWVTRYEGTFYRNYTGDLMALYEESSEVLLSRDGFLKLLPEGLLSDERELVKGETAASRQGKEARMKVMREVFLPFDTFAFRNRLEMERLTTELLEGRLAIVLKTVFGYDLTAETNPYVRKMAVLLPYVSRLRGDFSGIAKLLGAVFDCKIKMRMGRYSEVDSTRYWIPSVEYQLLVSGLTAEEYRKMIDDIGPMQDFVAEWLIPAEMRCIITVKHHRQPQRVGESLVLDYNSEL